MLNLFAIHGILQVLTFVILFPIGIFIALFREKIGKNWFILHVTIQSLASLNVFLALIVINIALKNKEKKEKKEKEDTESNKKPSLHVRIGTVIIYLVIFQLLWATIMRHIISRPIWYIIHILTAITIIILGWINIYYGMNHYKALDIHL